MGGGAVLGVRCSDVFVQVAHPEEHLLSGRFETLCIPGEGAAARDSSGGRKGYCMSLLAAAQTIHHAFRVTRVSSDTRFEVTTGHDSCPNEDFPASSSASTILLQCTHRLYPVRPSTEHAIPR